MEVPQKIKNNHYMMQQSQFWLFIQRNEIIISKRYLYSRVRGSIIHNSQGINRYMYKENVTYIMEYYSTLKKKSTCLLQQHGWTLRALC